MKVYIPNSIDVDKIVKAHPPTNVKNFHPEKLVCILSEITTKPKNDEGFVEIGAKLFQKKSHNYREYVDYSIDAGVLIVDEQFFHNTLMPNSSKTKGYKFSDDYNTTVHGVEIEYFPVVKKYAREKAESRKVSSKYNHLAKWFNEDLTIDRENAFNYLNFEKPLYQADYTVQIQNRNEIHNTWYESYPEKIANLNRIKVKDPIHRYNSTFMGIDKIYDHDFNMMVDDTSCRFHSNLTNLSTDYRNFLSYDGKPLVSIDIVNSQPYFSLKFFNIEFWRNFDFLFYSLFPNSTSISSSLSIILVESLQSIDKQEVSHFRKLILSGEFYDYLANEIEYRTGIKYSSRREIKALIFTILYSQNQFLGQPEAAPKRVFKELFPGIYQLLSEIKKARRNLVPILLQRLESYIVLEIITKRISKEYPKLPIFTIHDSIATTAGNEDYVFQVMEEELKRFVGAKPSLRIEPWAINQLKNYKKWINK